MTESTNDAQSISKAFYTTFIELADECGNKHIYESITDTDIEKLQSSWNAMLTPEFTSGCNEKNPDVLKKIADTFPSLETPDILGQSGWKCIHKLNGFTAVDKNVPSNMMGRIENMANMIATDLASGKMDMNSMNLNDIGKQVLAGCSESDMQDFAQNMDKLIPALANFQNML